MTAMTRDLSRLAVDDGDLGDLLLLGNTNSKRKSTTKNVTVKPLLKCPHFYLD